MSACLQLRSLWRTLLQRCPAELLESRLFPPLAVLLDHLVDRLDTRWAALQQATPAPAPTAATAEEQEEDTEVMAGVDSGGDGLTGPGMSVDRFNRSVLRKVCSTCHFVTSVMVTGLWFR